MAFVVLTLVVLVVVGTVVVGVALWAHAMSQWPRLF